MEILKSTYYLLKCNMFISHAIASKIDFEGSDKSATKETLIKYFPSRFLLSTVWDVRVLKTDFNIKHRFARPAALTARVPQAEFDDFRRKLSFISRTPNKSRSRQILPLWRPYHAYGSGLSAPVCLATPRPSPGI